MVKLMKMYYIFFLVAALILTSGCGQNTRLNELNSEETVETETERVYQELILGVNYRDRSCGEFISLIDGTQQTQPIEHRFSLDDDFLQEKAKSFIADVPIDTAEEIIKYAWEIFPFLIQSDYLEEDWGPVGANQYQGNIWLIFFAKGGYADHSMRDGTIDLYISGEDGHIIFISGQNKLQNTIMSSAE